MRRHVKDHLRLLALLEACWQVFAVKPMVRHLQRSPLAGESVRGCGEIGFEDRAASIRLVKGLAAKVLSMSSSANSGITFECAEREYREAWNNLSHTRFELPPVNVNKVLKDRYVVAPDKRITRSMIWDMETKKAWDPLSYIPYVVSEARSWGRNTLQDGSNRFCRSSLQRGWITSERGRVLEDVFVNPARQAIFFLGREQMSEEDGNQLEASKFQPIFHVEHSVGGSEDEPLNLWSIVLLTPKLDARYLAPFEQMVSAGLLPGFIEIYMQNDLGMRLTQQR
jgi:hypothetical protein